ncbi:hypothetical protein D0862_13542 [Hortaea werneckii]|uniref:ASST-domain-containing protein n=1 Tax=Hortaea werneckii TaxID=91943 RepID=A0A3M7EMB2_HORWE|nr:hypothetical protein D0862_13542 [Hortaea werneckii]
MNNRQWELQELGPSKLDQKQHAGRQRNSLWRVATITGAIAGCLVAIILLLRFLAVPLLVYLAPRLDLTFYDWGLYGAYPTQWYQSIDLAAPCARTVQWNDTCSDGLVMLSLSGPGMDYAGPMILDHQGELVWTTQDFGAAGNLKVQQYDGEDYLTFWAGEKLQESGQGKYYMLDSSYNVVHTVSAVGDGLYGDLHEFKVTDDATALITVYNKTHLDPADPAMPWPKNGFIIDGIVQEIDIPTGQLLFQWRASDHLLSPLFRSSEGGYVDLGALDYFHVNSVDKDGHGNFLISIRHLHLVVYVSGEDGSIIWALGGDADSFEDMSNGAASDFKWQHDARWIDRDQGLISLFDNGIARHHYADADHSEGRIIALDFDNRTASLAQAFRSPNGIRSASQGSVQILPAGEDGDEHVFVGWGSSGAYSEFTSDGDLLCETHFAASSLFYFERAKSYRATKAPSNWQAEPSWDPVAVINSDQVYASWNGATEVAWWMLQGQVAEPDEDDDDVDDDAGLADVDAFEDLDLVAKESFETSVAITGNNEGYSSYRMAALDVDMNVLRYSEVLSPSPSALPFIIWPALCVGLIACLVAIWAVRNWTTLQERFSFGRPTFAYRRIG